MCVDILYVEWTTIKIPRFTHSKQISLLDRKRGCKDLENEVDYTILVSMIFMEGVCTALAHWL